MICDTCLFGQTYTMTFLANSEPVQFSTTPKIWLAENNFRPSNLSLIIPELLCSICDL